MVETPGYKVLFLHESEQSSINVHQKFVYDYLPTHWKPTEERKIKRGLTTKVNYSLADGFTNNKFVLPNSALAQFAFYGQQIGDYEGGGWNLIVADENLPLGWLKTLLFRLPRVQGKFLWTYSPIAGITPAVKHVVTGARTLEHRRAPLLRPDHRASELQDWPPGHMPVLQESALPAARILYFFSEDNPWAGYEQLAQTLQTASTLDVERRAYGYARNTVRAVFPLFGRVNILPPDRMPTRDVTRYLIADPAGKRNFFFVWVAVDAHGRPMTLDGARAAFPQRRYILNRQARLDTAERDNHRPKQRVIGLLRVSCPCRLLGILPLGGGQRVRWAGVSRSVARVRAITAWLTSASTIR